MRRNSEEVNREDQRSRETQLLLKIEKLEHVLWDDMPWAEKNPPKSLGGVPGEEDHAWKKVVRGVRLGSPSDVEEKKKIAAIVRGFGGGA